MKFLYLIQYLLESFDTFYRCSKYFKSRIFYIKCSLKLKMIQTDIPTKNFRTFNFLLTMCEMNIFKRCRPRLDN